MAYGWVIKFFKLVFVTCNSFWKNSSEKGQIFKILIWNTLFTPAITAVNLALHTMSYKNQNPIHWRRLGILWGRLWRACGLLAVGRCSVSIHDSFARLPINTPVDLVTTQSLPTQPMINNKLAVKKGITKPRALPLCLVITPHCSPMFYENILL